MTLYADMLLLMSLAIIIYTSVFLSILNSSGTFFVAKQDPCDAKVRVRSIRNMLNNKYSE